MFSSDLAVQARANPKLTLPRHAKMFAKIRPQFKVPLSLSDDDVILDK